MESYLEAFEKPSKEKILPLLGGEGRRGFPQISEDNPSGSVPHTRENHLPL